MDTVPAQNINDDDVATQNAVISSQKEGMPVHTIYKAPETTPISKIETAQTIAPEQTLKPETLPAPETAEVTKSAPEPTPQAQAQQQPEPVQTIAAEPEAVPNVVDMTTNNKPLKNVAENADEFTEELDKKEGDFIHQIWEQHKQT